MKALEVAVQVSEDGSIHLPKDLAMQLPKDHPVKAVFLLDENPAEAWKALTAESFLAGYSPEDSIYDRP